MPVPKRRHSKSRKNTRRAGHRKPVVPTLSVCPECGEKKRSHVVCPHCGMYKGRQVLEMKEK